MDETIKLTYSAPSNITFHGEIDTGISPQDWAEMSQENQNEVIQEYVNELVNIGIKGELER
jgi:hypothetical protein